VGFVKHDDAVEWTAEPVDDLLDPAGFVAPGSSPGQAFGLRPQGRVSRKEDAFVERDRRALADNGTMSER
jgi:hypothetical protein